MHHVGRPVRDVARSSSTAPDRSLPRARCLKRRRLIRPLFDRSRDDVGSMAVGTVRLFYRVVAPEAAGGTVPVQVGFTTGRRIRKATARNRIKRLLREVYRLHQQPLVDLFSHRPGTLTLMILYRGDAAAAETRLRSDLRRALDRLVHHLEGRSAKVEGRDSAPR